MSEKVTIKCAGCAKTQTLRPRKVERCDGYYCGRCDFKTPPAPEGQVSIIVNGAAGGFWGYRFETPDEDTLAALGRARVLRGAGLKRIGQLN
ncbi:hypothetical protein IHN32_04015 [Deinococcus sp. 14RED07]|uniref:hypothetical protein n=1 Tax=Deinococcus TaxID=1298 RepID=UPI001998A96D|nr:MULTISPECIES: hypothetical protein [unclassified Deinococcus]MCD0160646.1 hypothetical protein [Deinococcus sp. 6YEL10]MCD0164387.1 hypothetical protein [Deinococcus sp. 12RED42]MCD0175116.1 hypothetical protein [Deinococcus sp. 14RED07]GGB79735.1 hypothetical protein GCM10008019_39990 [Deinococcus soli (ex Cha et al. 2016)]